MFHYDNGLKLTAIDLAIDVRRRQPRAFVSHAHSDHTAPHELAFCTPATARMYQHRHGPRRTREMPFGQPLEWGRVRLTTYPAGHVYGSAMLLAETEGQSLLYTGDFKLSPSATAEPALLPRADVMVMECTFGDERYRLPPREQVIEELLNLVRAVLADGDTPVIYAYVLGKAQEVTRILTDAGIPVQQHALAHEISLLYEECGCPLGDFSLYKGRPRKGHAVVMPPRSQKSASVPLPRNSVTIAVTGWAADPRARYSLGVDYAIPLSDHADYDELLQAVEQVRPKVVYCTHGPASFVDDLQEAGYDARQLGRATALRLFR